MYCLVDQIVDLFIYESTLIPNSLEIRLKMRFMLIVNISGKGSNLILLPTSSVIANLI